MNKLKTLLVSLFALVIAASCFAACGENGDSGNSETLSVPEIVLNDDYSVSWTAVEGATSYVVNVNGANLNPQEKLTFGAFTEAGEYTVKVKAKNAETESDYSSPVSYAVYSVTFPETDGVTFVGAKTVYSGKDYSFTAEITGEAYEGTLVVKANGETLTAGEDGKTYTVKAVNANLNVTAEGVSVKQFAVSLPSGDGYTVTGETLVGYGSDYVFTVAKTEGYEQSTLTVKVNGETVEETDGKYTVANVKENLEITVEGAVKNVYNVTLPTSVAYTISGNSTVIYGENYTFTLVVKEGYDASGLVVKVGETVLTSNDGTYTVENVKSDLIVTVEGLNVKKYDVSLPDGEGYTVTGENTVEHGADYQFTIELSEAYSDSDILVKVNGKTVKESDGKYTVSGVTEDLVVTVENVVINSYTVTVPESDKYTVTGETTVSHGGNVQIGIAVIEKTDVLRVFNGETELFGSDGKYTVENVTSDVNLTVKVYDVEAQLLLTDSWSDYDGSSKVENADGTVTVRGWQFGISAAYLQKAEAAGYTHLRFEYLLENKSDSATPCIFMCGQGVAYEKFYSEQRIARFDLSELKKDGAFVNIWMQGKDAADWSAAKEVSMTVSAPRLFKSNETLGWTKSNPKIYFAIEDGFMVLDTVYAGNDANVKSPAEWWAKYANNPKANEVGQNTIVLTGKYLYAGANNRGAIFGGNGEAVAPIGETANTDLYTAYMNNTTYEDGARFYLGLDKESVYVLKVSEFVSSRNSWGGFSYTYIDEGSFKVSIPDGGKFVYVNMQEMVAKGYTKVVLTASEYSDGQLWIGNDAWGENMFGLDGGADKELDLSIFTETNPYLVIYSSGSSTVTIGYRFF